jgi:4-amino-4-deoxy-L-arabinose transferase-like glycosyltransferase
MTAAVRQEATPPPRRVTEGDGGDGRSVAIGLAPLALFAGLLVAGIWLAPGRGLAWDEPDNAAFGRQALQAFATLRPPAEWHSNLESKGPAFVALAELSTAGLSRLNPTMQEVDLRHFVNFVTLPVSTAALFALAKRIVGPAAALAASALFASQPLLFGHAFINPKDTPFMAFFLLAMWSGLRMAEGISRRAGAGWLGSVGAAGVLLGSATAVRVFGLFAGILVTALALVRGKRSAVVPLVGYWLIAIAATFAAWPYLWGDPVGRFLESLQVLASFPWDNLVLYRGLVYSAPDLPWHYLPFTTVIQLTEPLLLLAIVGGVVGAGRLVRRAADSTLYAVLAVWTLIPYAASILTRSTVYDNSRQFLFAQPPLFLAAAIGLEALLALIRRPLLRAGLVALAVLPGLWSIGRLHPYEYVYYNRLVGGTGGAYRRYEMDYWATSYREAMALVNREAPAGATVEVWGPLASAAEFARPDLHVVKGGDARSAAGSPALVLVLTRSNADQWIRPEAPIVADVRLDGAVLAVVKRGPSGVGLGLGRHARAIAASSGVGRPSMIGRSVELR